MNDILKLSGKMRTIPMSNDKESHITDYDVITAMERYGGGFASRLAVACTHAHMQNLARIKMAFADLWAEYYAMAVRIKETEEGKNEAPPF